LPLVAADEAVLKNYLKIQTKLTANLSKMQFSAVYKMFLDSFDAFKTYYLMNFLSGGYHKLVIYSMI
jgi:hypothetical protein